MLEARLLPLLYRKIYAHFINYILYLNESTMNMIRKLLPAFEMPCNQIRWAALLLLLGVIFLAKPFPAHSYPLVQNIEEVKLSLNLKDVTLQQVFIAIEEKSDFKFITSIRRIDNKKKVTLSVVEKTIKEILDLVLKDTGLTFTQVNSTIVISNKSEAKLIRQTSSSSVAKQISGVVKDENNAPIPGVNVLVKGTTIGTITDGQGKYVITVNNDTDVLVFSYIGYNTEEVSVGNLTVIDLTLIPDIQSLNEVVVVGYGVQERKDVVGSVGVASRKDFGDIAVSSTSQLIQGKIAGVQVVNNGGNPGSGTQIVVRGTGSFTNAAPLYVIDGIQSDQATFNSLSPYDIQNITVLKDASSVAIYGAQGANGVVIITTRRPKNGAPKVTYNGYVGMAKAWKQFDMLNAAQYVDLVKEWYTNYGQPLPPRLATSDALITRTDWQKEMFRTAKLTEHFINIGGGTEHVNYSLSVGYTKQESPVIGLDYQRANIRLSLEEFIGKRFKLGQQLSIRHQVTNGVAADVLSGLRMPPYISIYDPTNLLGGYGIATSAQDGNDTQNPLIEPNLRDVKNRGLNNYLQLYGEVDLIEGLRFRSQLGGTFDFNQNYNYNPTYAANQLITQNQITEGYNYSLRYILENYFTYDKQFGSHSLNFTAGNSYRDGGVSRSVNLVGGSFANDEIHQIGVAKTVTLNSAQANSNARFISYFARLNYTLMDKYILTLTGRRDATSLFSKANRVGYFPSVGLGWRISQEAFMKDITFLSDLKLRASWGKTGNSNIAGFSYQSNVWTGSGNSVVYPLGSSETLVNGATVAIPSTPNLKWESTTTTDIGLDAAFFNNKLSISAGYYNRHNEDLLVNVPLALSTGYGGVSGASSSQLINAASAFNRGFELSAGYNGKAGELTYSISANGAYNKNEVTSLGSQGAVPIIDGAFYSVPAMTRTEVGKPIGSFYGYVLDHVAINEADVEKYDAIAKSKTGDETAVYQSGLLPGDRIFKDINGDGQVTEADQTTLGSPIPKWNYGLNLNLGYKNFDFMASLQGVADVQIINALKYYLEGVALPFNTKTTVLSRWQKPGDVTDIARAGQNYGTAANLRNSSWFVENGAFARIRNVTLGYTLPESRMKPLTSNVISSIRVYLTAQNLFTFTKYSGYDPEVSSIGNFIFNRGIDTGQVPSPRTFMVGLQVGF